MNLDLGCWDILWKEVAVLRKAVLWSILDVIMMEVYKIQGFGIIW
jgi:hypothetical protein